jgi:tetratricopeptide (TPR) repeat protein/TolB-like protein
MADDDLLQSWKEIAAYLERSERTCRRWETDFRLPVHRMDGSPRGSVFAYRTELDTWMSEILHEQDEPPSVDARPRLKKNLAIVLALAAMLVMTVAVVLLRIGRSGPKSPPPSEKPTLAILPFKNNTGDENLDFWESTLADLLVSDLSQSRYLTVLPQDRIFFVLRDLDLLDVGARDAMDLERVARRAKVENIVVGNFIKIGQRFRISATVRRMSSGETFVLPGVEAKSEDDILVRIDTLSTRIRNQLLSHADISRQDVDFDAGSITTSSIEAYRSYIEGRLSYFVGSKRDAMESLEMAVEIDPDFAMAHNYLAMCYRSFPGYEDEAEKAMSRAFELSHHVSPRERFFIQAMYYRTGGQRSLGQYLETCQEFVNAYPDDFRAHVALGEIYGQIEEWDKCIETLENAGEGDFPSPPYMNLQRAHGALGTYDEALAYVEASPAGIDSLRYRHQLALNLLYERRFEAALHEADAMLERSPGHVRALMIKGDVHLLRAEWDKAEANYRDLLNPVARESNRLKYRLEGLHRLVNLYCAKGQQRQALEIVRQAVEEVTAVGERKWLLSFHYRMATVHRARGDLDRAMADIEWALEEAERRGHVTGKIAALGMYGVTLLEMGNLDEAERAADEMKSEIDGWLNPKLMRCWHHLQGHIELARHDVGRAIEHFEEAVSLLPYQHEYEWGDEHAEYYNSLANASYLIGDLDSAKTWYQSILALTTGRLAYGDIYAKSYLMLGEIYKQQGMNAEAIRSYTTFLGLWRDADAGVPEVDEAKRSLADLLDQSAPHI